MAKLHAKTRNALAASQFAGPGRSFPIPDAEHGRKALQLDTHKPAAERAAIAAKVHSRFPGIGKGQTMGKRHYDQGASTVQPPAPGQTTSNGTWTPPPPSAGTSSGVRALTGMQGVPRPAPPRQLHGGSSDVGCSSGLDRAMNAHADRMHPVKSGVRAKSHMMGG